MLRDFNRLERIKVFEYLKNCIAIMGLSFFKRRTPPYMMKKDGSMSLKENELDDRMTAEE